jgi:hypothetical protein
MAISTLPAANTPFLMDNPVFDPGQFQAMMQVAEIMAQAKLVPEHLQGKPADCLLVVEQARRWNMSPFAVAQETYVVKGKLLFGGKLVTAVINSRAPIKTPLRFIYEGQGDNLLITATATLRVEDEPRTYSITVGGAKAVAGNSSLWKTDPKQQGSYFAARFWARLHCPEVILGVWSEDEIDTANMRDITPEPTAVDHARAALPPAEDVVLVDPDGEERAFTQGEVGTVVLQWCNECTDAELEALLENNPDVTFLTTAVELEQTRRDAKAKAAAKVNKAPDPSDPLNINGGNVGKKTAVSILETAMHDANSSRADELLEAYRIKFAGDPDLLDSLQKIVTAKIEAEFEADAVEPIRLGDE